MVQQPASKNLPEEESDIYLGPKLDRPLSLWNPLDYLKLLYWCFFFPQALRAYLNKFATVKYEGGKFREFLRVLRQDKLQSRLFWQSIVLTTLTPLLVCAGLRLLGNLISWSGVVGGMVFGIVLIWSWGVVTVIGSSWNTNWAEVRAGTWAGGVSWGVGWGVVGGLARDESVDLVATSVLIAGLVLGVAGGLGEVLVMGDGVVRSLGMAGFAGVTGFAGVAGFVGLRWVGILDWGWVGILALALVGVLVVVGGIVEAMTIMSLRIPDYILANFLAVPQLRKATKYQIRLTKRQIRYISPATLLPIPYLQAALERQLERDFQHGIELSNQLLTYTFQFFPVTWALNAYLSKLSTSNLFSQVGILIGLNPSNWDLLKYNSASLKFIYWKNDIFWRKFPPDGLKNDTPAHTICGGYWLLYVENPQKAVDFFRTVQDLPYGQEVYSTSLALSKLSKAKTYEEIYKLAESIEWPADLEGEKLRPEVVGTLETLRLISKEAARAKQSASILARSTALNRANGELLKLQQNLDTTCPLPERKIIKKVIEQWRDPLIQVSGEVGQVVLREPVNNPYVGFGGQPVEGQAFIGRRQILAQIETLWTNPGALPPLFLYGHRRMGKTSILRNLNLRRDPNTVLVLLDMQNVGSVDDTAQFYYSIGLEIYNHAVRSGWLTTADQPDFNSYSSSGLARLALNSFFSKLEEKRVKQRLILAIDEFELIEKRIKEGRILPETLDYLRSLTQKYNWLALIFGGLLTLEEMGKDYKAAFFGSSQSIKVSYLSRDEAEKLICQPDPEFLLEYEPALVDELFCLTNGQPYLLQLICWELVNAWNEKFLAGDSASDDRLLKLTDLEALFTDVFYNKADYYFSGVWGKSNQDEQTVLVAIAQSGENGCTKTELQAKLLTLQNLDDALKKLIHRDVICLDAATNRYRFAADLNRRWVLRTQVGN
jgi:AAA+ ATPase superfamily predicted ATPase